METISLTTEIWKLYKRYDPQIYDDFDLATSEFGRIANILCSYRAIQRCNESHKHEPCFDKNDFKRQEENKRDVARWRSDRGGDRSLFMITHKCLALDVHHEYGRGCVEELQDEICFINEEKLLGKVQNGHQKAKIFMALYYYLCALGDLAQLIEIFPHSEKIQKVLELLNKAKEILPSPDIDRAIEVTKEVYESNRPPEEEKRKEGGNSGCLLFLMLCLFIIIVFILGYSLNWG